MHDLNIGKQNACSEYRKGARYEVSWSIPWTEIILIHLNTQWMKSQWHVNGNFNICWYNLETKCPQEIPIPSHLYGQHNHIHQLMESTCVQCSNIYFCMQQFTYHQTKTFFAIILNLPMSLSLVSPAPATWSVFPANGIMILSFN